ncbi:proton-conducting transporter membrane subunit [Nocardioides sp. TF02-7]|uniref:proton-conducting transporter transmembrane domain-containing protein n=1 Tax=Nocardioides sp. TF02-7 TaxID=2917724 RepID=UPI001F0610C9|nr:proton-conducting transporter membrane subunit [Nocardioides sp. TF02-7]UMG91838.1 Na+/H+ antiporter subunit D [Nocardioides sp. TF02-7]
MTVDQLLVSLPVAAPLLAAGLSLLLSPSPGAQRVLAITVLTGVLVDGVLLLQRADAHGPVVAQVGGYRVPLGITLVGDRFSALMLVTSTAILLAVLVYAVAQGSSESSVGNVPSVFHPSYLALTAGTALAFLTGDLFNLFVGLEVMLMASYALITLGATRERVRAGSTYIVTSLLSSILLLTAIALVYGVTGTLNLAQLSERTAELPEDVRSWLSVALLVALSIKAAIVPMHWWLPESYPPAPAPITAVFAALLTKVAVYAVIRTQSLLFPRDEPWLLLLALAALTFLVGSIGALAQKNLHGVLSFLLVAHIGFMLLGLGISSAAGIAGSVVYLVHHIVVQAALFLGVGLVERHRGTASLRRLGGLTSTAPLLSVLFLLPALSLGGMPPLAGFVAKLAVLRAAVGADHGLTLGVAGVALLASLATLALVARVWAEASGASPARSCPILIPGTPSSWGRPPAAR